MKLTLPGWGCSLSRDVSRQQSASATGRVSLSDLGWDREQVTDSHSLCLAGTCTLNLAVASVIAHQTFALELPGQKATWKGSFSLLPYLELSRKNWQIARGF